MAKQAKSKNKKRRISKRKVLRLVLVLALIIYGPIALIQYCGDDEARKLSKNPEQILLKKSMELIKGFMHCLM